MTWLSRKPKEKEFKKVKKVKRMSFDGAPQDFDIKKIYVNLTFTDRRTFTTTVYGSFYQHLGYGYRPSNDDVVGEPIISSALSQAQQFISNMTGPITYTDDPKNSKMSITGQVASASIDLTQGEISYIEKHIVATLVEKELEI